MPQRIKRTIKNLFFPMAILFIATSFTGAYFSDSISVTGNNFSTGSGAEEPPVADPEPAKIVINEIDYEQPGIDTAEFVELKNIGGMAGNLQEYVLKLINGAVGGASAYQSIILPTIDLAAGDYFVICSNSSTVVNCDLDVISTIQNGPNDAVALFKNDAIVDTVSYEGDIIPPYLEGSGVGLEDTDISMGGVSRLPDGSDSNSNNIDFQFRPITPGMANL